MSNQKTEHRFIKIAGVTVLILVLFGLRLIALDADPPIDLSTSTDVYTDPAQYTLFAKQKVIEGEFNPHDDNRFVFFLNSSMTLLAYVIFTLFGVSLKTANITAIFYSFGSLLGMYGIIHILGGWRAALFYLLFIGINYNHLFYGRLTFLEHAMTFYAIMAGLFLVWRPSVFTYVISGLLLGVAVFFGKVIGIVFLAPFFGYLIWDWYTLRSKSSVTRAISFLVGLIGTVTTWFFVSYLPTQKQVTGYVGEQAVSLYGAPEGLESVNNFIWKFVSFGMDTHLFDRFVIPALLGLLFVGAILRLMLTTSSWKDRMSKITSGELFLFLYIVSFYLSLMIWNYRPLRYQVVLIYPICAVAGLYLARFIERENETVREKPMFWYVAPMFLMIFLLLYQTADWIVNLSGDSFFYNQVHYSLGGISLVAAIIVYLLWDRLPVISVSKKVAVYVSIGLISLSLGLDTVKYYRQMVQPTFTIKEISNDVKELLSPEAVVSGPYGPTLSLDNTIPAVIHMFGVSQADTTLFERFPVTHLLLDSGNENRARQDYPQMMAGAEHLLTYYIADEKVRLYRVAGVTRNDRAKRYRLSLFEHLLKEYDGGKGRLNNELAIRFFQQYPENSSAHLFLGEAAQADSIYPLAETMFKKAVEFSPTNYNLTARLAKFYADRFTDSKNVRYLDKALELYDRSLSLHPGNYKIKEARTALAEKRP